MARRALPRPGRRTASAAAHPRNELIEFGADVNARQLHLVHALLHFLEPRAVQAASSRGLTVVIVVAIGGAFNAIAPASSVFGLAQLASSRATIRHRRTCT